MSEFKGTPGPWVRDHNMVYSLQDSDSKLTDTENRFYARFYRGRNCSTDELSANVQVAMAAPELLQELRQLEVSLNTIKYCYEKRPENMWKALETAEQDCQRAREIIKKALGEA